MNVSTSGLLCCKYAAMPGVTYYMDVLHIAVIGFSFRMSEGTDGALRQALLRRVLVCTSSYKMCISAVR
jgi:hypothetical protein